MGISSIKLRELPPHLTAKSTRHQSTSSRQTTQATAHKTPRPHSKTGPTQQKEHRANSLWTTGKSFLYAHTPSSRQVGYAIGCITLGAIATLRTYPASEAEEIFSKRAGENIPLNMVQSMGVTTASIAIAAYCTRKVIARLKPLWDDVDAEEKSNENQFTPRSTAVPLSTLETTSPRLSLSKNILKRPSAPFTTSTH